MKFYDTLEEMYPCENCYLCMSIAEISCDGDGFRVYCENKQCDRDGPWYKKESDAQQAWNTICNKIGDSFQECLLNDCVCCGKKTKKSCVKTIIDKAVVFLISCDECLTRARYGNTYECAVSYWNKLNKNEI